MATELPRWDYWMWDDKGEFIFKYAHTMTDHPDADYLWETEWDEKWVRKLFWTAEQATALSFGRSPDEVPWDDQHWGVKVMDGSSEFASYFCMLRDEILEAQGKGLLPSSIPALMYIEWTEKYDIPFPPNLAGSVIAYHKMITDDAERFVRLEELVQQQSEELRQLREHEKAEAEPHPRLRNNLLKVIVGVAKDKYQYPRSGTAKRISDALLRQEISLSEETILGYLKQAEDED
jgi:hypothetical protein